MCKRMSFFSFSCNIFAIVILFLKSKISFYMKFWYKFLFLPVFILALVGCKDDDDQTIPTLSAKDGFSLVLPYDINKGANLTFTASDDWTISSTGISSWLSFSKTSGGDGENTILVKARNYNCTNEDEHYSFTITSTNAKGTTNVDVTVTHEPVFRLASLAYEADPKGETLHISVKTKANILSSLFVLCDKEFESMWDQSELPSNAKGKVEGQVKGSEKKRMRVAATRAGASGDEYILDFVIKPNTTSHVRTGCFWLGVGNDESMLSDMITVSQKALDTYSSQDMETDDGKVTLTPDSTNGLSDGTHKIVVTYEDGSTDTIEISVSKTSDTTKVSSSKAVVSTGETSEYLTIACICGFVAIMIFLFRRRFTSFNK